MADESRQAGHDRRADDGMQNALGEFLQLLARHVVARLEEKKDSSRRRGDDMDASQRENNP
jgi:hypothetical protein